MKVLFHVDEPEKWRPALANLRNMVDFYQSASIPFEIELVANGTAVKGLTLTGAGPLSGAMDSLHRAGVAFKACRNALAAQGIPESALCGFAGTVPAGVVEIAQKQSEGYAYIKP